MAQPEHQDVTPTGHRLEWTDVDSSNVDAVAYDEPSHSLVVLFTNGGLYSYDDVEMQVYVEMVHAESVGKYLNQMVKGRYAYHQWFNEQELLVFIQKPKQ